MNDNLLIEFIASSLKLEVSNHFEINENEIIVILDDQTKAKITTKNII